MLAAHGNLLAIFVVGLVWAAFAFRLIQMWRALAGASAGEQRDSRSWVGFVLQGLAIGIAFFGPVYPLENRFGAEALATAVLPIVFAVAGFVLFDSAARELGLNWSLVARVREDHTLVTSGPFALVRNPIYLALLMMTIGMGIALGHLVQLTVAVPLFILATALRVLPEERLLRERFGAAYDDYAMRVARLIPWLW